jgi:glucosamine-6-phosphate deaminase
VTAKTAQAEKLHIRIYESRDAMGQAAARHVIDRIREVLTTRGAVNIIFAAAPSQNEFLANLTASKEIDWSRVVGFHMDEYIHLARESGQLFSQYLARHLLTKVMMKEFYMMNAQAPDPETECDRYAELLKKHPPDIVCMGIGENGHIAFNDPPVADFADPKIVKIAELDEPCRQQQVNDGCFPTLNDVPRHAMTLTIPALMAANHLSIVVPSVRKAEAVYNTVHARMTHAVPSTILRTHGNAILFLDTDSASRL